MDRRADPRVEVKLRCHAILPGMKTRVFAGLTENISRSGVLVAWDEHFSASALPRPGDLLTVDIELPANRAFGRRCMHCEAVVVRLSPPEYGTGARVALQINQMSFRTDNGRVETAAAQGRQACSLM